MNESIESIVAEMRRRIAVKMSDAWYTQVEWRNLCDRIEAAWKREREASEDETLVKSCNTCKHFQLKRKWCRVHDYSPCDPSKLPLIWPNGPCPQWECKYNSRGGVEK